VKIREKNSTDSFASIDLIDQVFGQSCLPIAYQAKRVHTIHVYESTVYKILSLRTHEVSFVAFASTAFSGDADSSTEVSFMSVNSSVSHTRGSYTSYFTSHMSNTPP
jgi:hypothetical protein